MYSKKLQYPKKDPISHILDRPDMYVGSKRIRNIIDYISEPNMQISKKNINISPAFIRIFIEVLSNTIYNWARSKNTNTECTKIKINIDVNTGQTTIWNDGSVIPIEKHDKEDCYNHSMIFGQLLTGSNYDDTEDRLDISGRNGFGVKLCLKKGTLIPLWNGLVKKIENITFNDVLIGDDGELRIILDKIEGFGRLFKVSYYKNIYVVKRRSFTSTSKQRRTKN